MLAFVVAAVGGVAGLLPSPAAAAQATTAPHLSRETAQPIQYYEDRRHYRDEWERRRHWREHRRARDEARIAEAARREAWRIQQERAQRWAWRHAQRERYGY